MFSDVLKSVATITDQDEFLNTIDILRESLYTKDIDITARLKKIRADFAAPIQTELENAADKAKILEDLRLAVKAMRVINIQVGFNYSLDFVPKMAVWIKENIGEDVVVDVQTDLHLLGGATISFDGKYRDYTVRASLDKVWKN